MNAPFLNRARYFIPRKLVAQATRNQRYAGTANKAEGIGEQPKANHEISTRSLLFFGMPIAVTFSLGVWQVCRLQRKMLLIDEREKRLSAQPLTADDFSRPKRDTEYHRIELSGRFLHNLEMLVGPRSAPKNMPTPVLQWGGSSGLQVITPFELDTGEVILVNRGWVPQRLATAQKRSKAAVSPIPFLSRVTESTQVEVYGDGDNGASTRITFTAVIRGCDEKNRFTPHNRPETGEWYYVDPDAMMESAQLKKEENKAAVVELLEPLPKSGWPYPRSYEEFLQFRTPPSTHITYATTWFCLSGALALLTRNRLKQPVRTHR